MTAKEEYLVDAKGRKTRVILSVRRYKRLMEDLHDLGMVAERRHEKPISLAEMKKQLKKDGLL